MDQKMSESHCKCSLASQYPVLPEGAHIDKHPQDRNKVIFKNFPFIGYFAMWPFVIVRFNFSRTLTFLRPTYLPYNAISSEMLRLKSLSKE